MSIPFFVPRYVISHCLKSDYYTNTWRSEKMKKLLILLPALVFCIASANVFGGYIELTTDALGLTLGSEPKGINHQGNDSYVEADRPGQLITSTAANVGSVLTIQSDGTAGSGTGANPLLVTVTARRLRYSCRSHYPDYK
jgi:hypothetical protein